jgi:hypothetical protein
VVGIVGVTLPCAVAVPVHEPGVTGPKFVTCRLPMGIVFDTATHAGPEVLAFRVAATDVQLIWKPSDESVTVAEQDPPLGWPHMHVVHDLPSM